MKLKVIVLLLVLVSTGCTKVVDIDVVESIEYYRPENFWQNSGAIITTQKGRVFFVGTYEMKAYCPDQEIVIYRYGGTDSYYVRAREVKNEK